MNTAKTPNGQSERAGRAVMLTGSQSFTSGLSGRDRSSRRGSVTKPRAGNAVGLKSQPGQMVVLICCIGPSPPRTFFSLLPFNVAGRGALAQGWRGPCTWVRR